MNARNLGKGQTYPMQSPAAALRLAGYRLSSFCTTIALPSRLVAARKARTDRGSFTGIDGEIHRVDAHNCQSECPEGFLSNHVRPPCKSPHALSILSEPTHTLLILREEAHNLRCPAQNQQA